MNNSFQLKVGVSVLCAIVACATAEKSAHSTAVKKGEVFNHPSFGISFPLPFGWNVVSKNLNDFRKKKSLEITTFNESTKNEVENRIQRLLVLQKYPSGTAPGKNTSINISSALAYEKQQPIEYQEALIQQLNDMIQGEVKNISKPEMVVLGGRKFARMSNKFSIKEMEIYQLEYDTFDGDYILSLQIAGASQNELKEADAILQKINFGETK